MARSARVVRDRTGIRIVPFPDLDMSVINGMLEDLRLDEYTLSRK